MFVLSGSTICTIIYRLIAAATIISVSKKVRLLSEGSYYKRAAIKTFIEYQEVLSIQYLCFRCNR